MLRICKISGQVLGEVSTEHVHDIRDVKRELRHRHSLPVWMQQLLHKGNSLDDSSKVDDLLQDASSLNELAQSDSSDAPICLQLVLAPASTAVELREATELFRVACRSGELETAQMLLQAGAEKDSQDLVAEPLSLTQLATATQRLYSCC